MNSVGRRRPTPDTAVVFSDAEAAARYDVMNPWDPARPEVVFCTELVMAALAVLDVGCGTGSMLHCARELGHTGRLVGLDPDQGMLDRARRRTDIEWVCGVAADAAWDGEFDLVTMTSNAFQCLVTDDELRASLTAIRTSLRDGGRFVFGTRHPQLHEWDKWGTLRFLDVPPLAEFLTQAGFTIEGQYGDWCRGLITETSREIITIARPV